MKDTVFLQNHKSCKHDDGIIDHSKRHPIVYALMKFISHSKPYEANALLYEVLLFLAILYLVLSETVVRRCSVKKVFLAI